jgi:LmbE family N-acetylglucosaminyl deacetylase
MAIAGGILAVLLLAFLALRLLAPRAMAPAQIADPVAAKAAGDALLASRDTTTLIVVAHPDDTEWWAAGTAAMLAEHNPVVLVVGTSGERGDGGLVANLASVRERLQREGGAVIGYSHISFLRNPDGGLASATAFPQQVEDAFRTYRPANVITFDAAKEAAGYHHPDHEAAGRVTAAVAEKLGGVTLYLMHTSAPDVLVDYGPVKDAKAKAFAILTSYHTLTPVVGWLSNVFGPLLGPAAPTYGARAAYPQVGVSFGEVFRKVVVPAK